MIDLYRNELRTKNKIPMIRIRRWRRWGRGVKATLTDSAVFKFWRRRVPSQRLRTARYLNILCWMCQAKSGWPKWQKYHALRGDTALEPKFYVIMTKRLALLRAVSDFSPPEGAEGGTHAWLRSRLITGFGGGEAKDPPALQRWSVTRSPGHHYLHWRTN